MSPLAVSPLTWADDVVDEDGIGRDELRQDERGHVGHARHEEVATAEHEVPEQSEDPVAANLAEVHPGDGDERQDGHQHLETVANDHLGRRDGGGVEVRMADLDADEEHSGADRCRRGGPSERAGCDGHVALQVLVGPWRVSAGLSGTYGARAAAGRHHMM
jgi:hypothetical protein